MSRTPRTTTAQPKVELDSKALAKAGAAATELVLMDEAATERLNDLITSLAYEGPVTVAAVTDHVRFYQRRTAEACVEVGKGLLLLKELTPHGEFEEAIDGLDMSYSSANRFMALALKFSKSPTLGLLQAAGTQGKALELLALDDDQVDALARGEAVGSIHVDKLDTMTAKELKAFVRELQEGAAAKDQVIANQADKLTKHEERLAKPFKPKKDNPAKTAEDAAALQELQEATTACEVDFLRLAVVVGELSGHDSRAMRERGLQAVAYMVALMRETVLSNALDVAVDDDALLARPAWLPGVDNKEA